MSESRSPQAVLAEVPLFSSLSKRQLAGLVKMAREVEHPPGGAVAEQGRGSLAFHVVLSGYARVLVGGQRRRTLGPGDYFGEISLIDKQPRSATVEATEDGPLRTLAISSTDFNRLLDSDKTFARAVLVQLCARLRAVEAS